MERWEEVLELTKKLEAYCVWIDVLSDNEYKRIFIFTGKKIAEAFYEEVLAFLGDRTKYVYFSAKRVSVSFGCQIYGWRFYDGESKTEPLFKVPHGVPAEKGMEWIQNASQKGGKKS